jgi:protein gp37
VADHSKIEWTDATWSPVTGCTRVSDGCLHCYIERTPPFRMAGRKFDHDGIGATTGVRLHSERLDKPMGWRKPRRIFVCSMADLFHDDVPDGFIGSVWNTMALTPQHTYQILTKRPARMRSLLSKWAADDWHWRDHQMRWCGPIPGPLPNVWIGTSVESQQWADIRIPNLLDTPAAVRFLSCEPLLGPVDLSDYVECGADWLGHTCDGCTVDWVICGGESGDKDVRPMHPDWARLLRDQCVSNGVAFHFKQWGEHAQLDQLPADAVTAWELRNGPGYPGSTLCHVGKKAAGRELDGRTWDEYPAVRS